MRGPSVVLLASLLVLLLVRIAWSRGWLDGLVPLSVRGWWNTAAFALRRAVRLRRGPPTLRHEPKDASLFAYLPQDRRAAAQHRADALCATYHLDALRDHSTCEVFRDNLFVLDVLDRSVPAPAASREICALDVGSQDFRYAYALANWLAHAGATTPRRASLRGIELDGYVVYRDLHSRADHGVAHARLTGNPRVHYVVEDFLRVVESGVDVVFFLFPFVLEPALVRWGLPPSAFAPEALFRRASEVLREGGQLVVMNQTFEERDALHAMLDRLTGWEIAGTATATSDLVPYHDRIAERTVTVARRIA